jgi:hypothetical protein
VRNGAGVHARAELAVLAARVDPRREILKQLTIELSTNEVRIELPGVHAREARAKTAVDHLFGRPRKKNFHLNASG